MNDYTSDFNFYLNFVPLKEAMRKTPTFDPVPKDRLIEVVNAMCTTFTSEFGKDWTRSGYLTAFFAKKLEWNVKGAFVDGNVGIIPGLNVIAFLNLEITTNSTASSTNPTIPEKYPMSYSGFMDFLTDQISEVCGTSFGMLPQGMQELMKCTRDPDVPDHMIIYHPEFLSLEGIAALYLQGWRVIRREMPALDEDMESHDAILQLHRMLSSNYFYTCLNDDIVKSWLGIHKPKSIAVPGLLGLPTAGSSMNSKALTKGEWGQLKSLFKKLYVAGGFQASNANSPTYTTSAGIVIPKNPNKEAGVLDVHRYCTSHPIEDESVEVRRGL